MSEEKKTEVQKAMEKDCIILFTANEILTMLVDILSYRYPGRFGEGEGGDGISIDTKCRGPACAQYDQFNNVCRLR